MDVRWIQGCTLHSGYRGAHYTVDTEVHIICMDTEVHIICMDTEVHTNNKYGNILA